MLYSPKKFNIYYEANLDSPNKNIIKSWVIQPLNSTTQNIQLFNISIKPKSSYKDALGNKILYFEFKNQGHIKIQMTIKTVLWKNKINLKNEKISLPSASTKLFNQYTKSEKFLEQTSAIKQLTQKITNKNSSILDNIFSITQFLRKNFKYTYPIKKRGAKNLDLNNLKGDCGEAGALFVTMCRILGIPVINRTGYVIYYDELNNIYEHGWTSVYLKPYGWIDIDPMGDNLSKIGNNKYLYCQKNYFLCFTNGFNIKLKPKIPNNFSLQYWNENGLPLTHNSVQILQPLIFASLRKINFSDQIELY